MPEKTHSAKRGFGNPLLAHHQKIMQLYPEQRPYYEAKNSQRRQLRRRLVRDYSFAIPDYGSLKILAEYSPLVSLGAGTGYWEHLLQAMGCEVHAYDETPPTLCEVPARIFALGKTMSRLQPPPELIREYPYQSPWPDPEKWHHAEWILDHLSSEDIAGIDELTQINNYHFGCGTFTEVKKANHEILASYQDPWTLFLCWPPPRDPMSSLALQKFRGQRVIYVGEMEEGGCTADDHFLCMLRDEYQEVDHVGVFNWPDIRDTLSIWEKK